MESSSNHKSIARNGQESSEFIAEQHQQGWKKALYQGREEGLMNLPQVEPEPALWSRHTDEDKNSIENSNSQLEFIYLKSLQPSQGIGHKKPRKKSVNNQTKG